MVSITDLAPTAPFHPRTLLVDNYDSYTFNLLHLLVQQYRNSHPRSQGTSAGELISNSVVVIRNDQYSWSKVRDQILPHIDNIIISPGPGRPEVEEDFGVCRNLILHSNKPLLGVCLGHQGIASAFGADIIQCPVPVHGQTSKIEILDSGCATSISTNGDAPPGLFDGIPDLFEVVRYHSLAVSGIPDDLQVLARARGSVQAQSNINGTYESRRVESNEIMALRHKSLPLYGVQFHPESICSEHGAKIIENFNRITEHYYRYSQHAYPKPYSVLSSTRLIPQDILDMSLLHPKPHTTSVKLESGLPLATIEPRFVLVADSVDLSDLSVTEDIGKLLFNSTCANDPMPIWLDSAKHGDSNSNISVIASARSPGSVTIRYTLSSRKVHIHKFSEDINDNTTMSSGSNTLLESIPISTGDTFWDWMQDLVQDTRVSPDLEKVVWTDRRTGIELPEGFRCGWTGYFGYEMKAETVAFDKHHRDPIFDTPNVLPDAQLTFIDRCILVDHTCSTPRAIVLALATNPHFPDNNNSSCDSWIRHLGNSFEEAEQWVSEQTTKITTLLPNGPAFSAHSLLESPETQNKFNIPITPTLSRKEYIDAIRQAQEWIARGESYEVCLTNQFQVNLSACSSPITSAADIVALYSSMRLRNPAPYGALFWFPDIHAGIASCSPERFLKIQQVAADSNDVAGPGKVQRQVEMKPIKGTAKRDPLPTNCPHQQTPSPPNCYTSTDTAACPKCISEWRTEDAIRVQRLLDDVKERAENLMIVDLIRHDLNQVAVLGSVLVPKLMTIESYATVHQMVTTVRSVVRSEIGDVDTLAHCFPPGSMTGAPKCRTLQLLHKLETQAKETREPTRRGVYSGCLGYFSAHGDSDWSVVIRTAVVDKMGERISVGAGGALTILSDPEEEWREVETKLGSVLPGIRDYISSRN